MSEATAAQITMPTSNSSRTVLDVQRIAANRDAQLLKVECGWRNDSQREFSTASRLSINRLYIAG